MSELRKAAEQALKLIEGLEQNYGNLWQVPAEPEQLDFICNTLRAALAEPEQEPVAWMFQHDETGRTTSIDKHQLDSGWELMNPRWRMVSPLFAHPPRREPLTDEQVGMLTVFHGLHHVETPVLAAFIRHIERVITGGKT